MWLAMLTQNSYTFTPTLLSLYDAIYSSMGSPTDKLVMPSSCTLANYLATGTCSMQFTGLRSLFKNRDLNVRAIVRQCPGADSLASIPEVYVDCVGADCSKVFNPFNYQYCRQDSDCANTDMTCRTLSDYKLDGDKGPIGDLLWGGGDASDTCGNLDTFNWDFLRLLNALGSNGAVPAQPTDGQGVCTPAILDVTNASSWADSAVTNTNGLITVNGLQSFVPLAGEQAPTMTSNLPCRPVAATITPMTPPNTPPASSSSSSSSAPVDGLTDLFVLDCQGNFNFLPSHPVMSMGVSSALINKVYQFAFNTVLSRVQCHCPALNGSKLRDYYGGNVMSFLHALQDPNPSYATQLLNATCNGASWLRRSLKGLQNVFGMDGFPETCTWDKYQTSGCTMQWNLPYTRFVGNSLQIGIKDCPASRDGSPTLPYVSVTCNGPLCRQMFKPCKVDADW